MQGRGGAGPRLLLTQSRALMDTPGAARRASTTAAWPLPEAEWRGVRPVCEGRRGVRSSAEGSKQESHIASHSYTVSGFSGESLAAHLVHCVDICARLQQLAGHCCVALRCSPVQAGQAALPEGGEGGGGDSDASEALLVPSTHAVGLAHAPAISQGRPHAFHVAVLGCL